MSVISPTIKFNPQSNKLITVAAGYVKFQSLQFEQLLINMIDAFGVLNKFIENIMDQKV